MIEQGYNSDDVAKTKLTDLLFDGNVLTRLTRKFWREFKAPIEHLIIVTKEARKMEARKTLVSLRRGVLCSAYWDYQRTIKPVEWSTMPHYEDLFAYEAFSTLIDDPSEMKPEVSAYAQALRKLPKYISDWRYQRMKRLLAQIPTNGTQATVLEPISGDLLLSMYYALTTMLIPQTLVTF
ncbi:hypothetical protein H0H87_010004 [Tephrocybe sp. NHM501043]|nr:hypothetical protein H0H87_010004 [Tephrocybe sp. NHM501043]